MLFSSGNIFANYNVENLVKKLVIPINIATVEPDCKIIEKNTYNFCKDHGFTKEEAAAIAKAAADQCKKVK